MESEGESEVALEEMEMAGERGRLGIAVMTTVQVGMRVESANRADET